MARLTALQRAEREAQVIELKAARVPERKIAEQLGISQQRVSQIFTKAIDRIPVKRLDHYREEERQLADAAVESLLGIIADPTTTTTNKIKSWEAVVKVMERKARLLGLDSATKREIEIYDSSLWEAQIRQEIADEERAYRISQAITVDQKELES